MRLTSSAFEDGAPIPARYTCDGQGLSPPLAWEGIPEATRSLVLVVDDPDAPDPARPERIWVHWVLFNLSPDGTGLPRRVGRTSLSRARPTGLRRGGHRPPE